MRGACPEAGFVLAGVVGLAAGFIMIGRRLGLEVFLYVFADLQLNLATAFRG